MTKSWMDEQLERPEVRRGFEKIKAEQASRKKIFKRIGILVLLCTGLIFLQLFYRSATL